MRWINELINKLISLRRSKHVSGKKTCKNYAGAELLDNIFLRVLTVVDGEKVRPIIVIILPEIKPQLNLYKKLKQGKLWGHGRMTYLRKCKFRNP